MENEAPPRVRRIRLSISNAWLVPGGRPVLIDSGVPGDFDRLIRALRRLGVAPESLAWILHTHGHSDHAGCTARLAALSGAKTAVHSWEADRVRAGHHGTIHPRDWMARAMHPFLNPEFPPFEPDAFFDAPSSGEEGSLAAFGLPEGRWLHTPGHTSGSVSFILGGGDAVIGDLFRGSLWRPDRPRAAFFHDDEAATLASIGRLLATGARGFLPGHFGEMSRAAVERQFGTGVSPGESDRAS